MIQDSIVGLFVLAGSAWMLIAALGALRMPDLLTRMQATTKAASLGVGLVLMGAAVHFARLGVTSRVIAAVAFVVLTAPIAAHLLARAAYFLGVPLWEGSVRDDLRGKYDVETHELSEDDPSAMRRMRRAPRSGDNAAPPGPGPS